MSRVNVDFSEADSFPLIDQGLYPASVVGVDVKKSEKTGNEYFEFNFEIASGEFKGMKVYHRNAINAKDRNGFLKQTLDALNYEVAGVSEIETADLYGRSCMIQITHTEYQGKTRAEISGLFPIDDVPVPATSDNEPW